MDRNLVTTYGFIVILTLTLAVLMAFATPFGDYIGEAYVIYIVGAKDAVDEEIDHGFDEQQKHYQEIMNEGKFVAYVESGLYKTDDTYKPGESYDASHDILLNDWHYLTLHNIIAYQDASIRGNYNNRVNPPVNTSSEQLVGDLVLNDSVFIIQKSCFAACHNLTSVYCKSVKQIDDYAFANCSKLQTLYLNSTNLQIVGAKAFYGSGLKDIYFNGTREDFSKIKWASPSNKTVTIHCTDQVFSATI